MNRIRIRGGALLGGLAIANLCGVASLFDLAFRAQLAILWMGGSETATAFDNNGFLVAILVVGNAYSALGGWAAGRLAEIDETLHGTVVGMVGVLIATALYLVPQEGSTSPLWFDVTALLTTIPSAAFGGYLAFVQRGGAATRG